ncbi:UNKNOWN [Stylonychia lemnae]|uniref:F-box domain-containing protein n=1 Tax=Stylonychia lemnae TaxID=5949 RepID=A0A078AAV4_STYLE|nr:UNKNOWN [Stylonychia lemnae]|eukprot:CDW77923.1 UNKNOWN [Stylonychia lemnae]
MQTKQLSCLKQLGTNQLGDILQCLELPEIIRFQLTCQDLFHKLKNKNSIWLSILQSWMQDENHSVVIHQNEYIPQILRLNSAQFNKMCKYQSQVYEILMSIHQLTSQCLHSDSHLMIEGIESSTQDYDQSIMKTVQRHKNDYFWSSEGSKNESDQEYLIYKIASRDQSESALITSIVMKVFQANFQFNDPLYPPKQIQIEIGNELEKYHYKSKIFQVIQNTQDEQKFSLYPDLVCGQYIKITLFGKPQIQRMNGQRYIAIGYVGLIGQNLRFIQQANITNLLASEELQIKERESDQNEELKTCEKCINLQEQQNFDSLKF